MVGDIFYEHSHRLVASFVGLLTIALALTFWLRERARLAALARRRRTRVGDRSRRSRRSARGLARTHVGDRARRDGAGFFRADDLSGDFHFGGVAGVSATRPMTDGGRLRRLCAITTGSFICRSSSARCCAIPANGWMPICVFAALVAIHVILIVMRVTRHHAESRSLTQTGAAAVRSAVSQFVLGGLSYFGQVYHLCGDLLRCRSC